MSVEIIGLPACREHWSDTISVLRFPLMVGIVFIHFNLNEGLRISGVMYGADMPTWYYCMTTLLSDVLPRIGVPLFFLISGYLFFASGLTKESYQRKLKKRTRTLLVPYIIWNLIAVLYTSIKMSPWLKPMFPGYGDVDLSLGAFLNCFWNARNGMFPPANITEVGGLCPPQDVPMWYVRDLMIMILFAPLFYWIIKKVGWYAVLFFGFMWYIIIPLTIPIDYGFATAAFFFSWGACHAIKGADLASSMRRFSIVPWLYAATAIADMLTKEWEYSAYLHKIGIVLGIITAVSLTAYLLEKGKLHVNKFLAASSFFLFALHIIFMGDMGKIIGKFSFVDAAWYMTLLYFLVPTMAILICLGLYWLLRRYTPRLCALLTGGR